ncbi:hypothetical protein UlMin_040056 [Ulmus minor]
MANNIVLKVYMHCEGCKDQVSKCLRGFDGIQEVVLDRDNNTAIIKGKNIDHVKVLEKLKKKCSRNVELVSLSPNPKPEDKGKKMAEKKDDKQPKLKIMVLKMNMHCEGCSKDIKRDLERLSGVLTVEPNMEKSTVSVRGIIDPQELLEYIKKRLGKKHVEISKVEIERDDHEKEQLPRKKNVEILKVVEIEKKNERDDDDKEQFICCKNCPPPQYICPCDQMFSDENPSACSII